MVGGFNTNVRYQGRVFHVQTEDSGLECPHVVTLLYEGGAILASRKTSYAEQVADPELEARVRELMEDQHRRMVQALKSGKLDGRLGIDASGVTLPPDAGANAPVATAPAVEFGAGILTGNHIR